MTAPLVIHMLRVVRALRKGAYRRATFFLISDALRSRHEGIFGFERSGKCRLRPSTALGNFKAGESVTDFGVYSKAGMHYADVDAPLFTSADRTDCVLQIRTTRKLNTGKDCFLTNAGGGFTLEPSSLREVTLEAP